MKKQLRSLTDELNALKAVTVCYSADLEKQQDDFSELERSVEFLSDALDAAKAKNSSLVVKNNELIEKNEALESKVDQLDKYLRANNLELRGVPVTKDEDGHGILHLLGNEIECALRKEDIDTAHRVPNRKADEMNIVVRFCARAKPSEFLAKARKTGPTTMCLGFTETQQVLPMEMKRSSTRRRKTSAPVFYYRDYMRRQETPTARAPKVLRRKIDVLATSSADHKEINSAVHQVHV